MTTAGLITRFAVSTLMAAALVTGCGGKDKGGNRSPIFNTGVAATVIEPGGALPSMPPPILTPPTRSPRPPQQTATHGARGPGGPAPQDPYGPPQGNTHHSSRGGAQTSAPSSTASQGGARILSPGAYPGAPPPGYPGAAPTTPPAGYPAGAPTAPPAGYPRAGTQYPSPERGGGGGMVSIGGATTIDTRTEKRDMKPVEALATNPLFWPVAIVAWPFKKMVESQRGSAQQSRSGGPNTPTNFPEPLRPEELDRRQDREQTLAMERALADRAWRAPVGATSPPPVLATRSTPYRGTAPGGGAPGAARSHPTTGPRSIAEELAALRRRAGTSPPPLPGDARGANPRSAMSRPSAPPQLGEPRSTTPTWRPPSGEGFPQPGRSDPQRHRFDDNGDGIADREEVYDADGLIAETAEDSDRDGAIDTWTRYRNGAPVRRRADLDGDGLIDAWTYYADGGLDVARMERDTDGDGYRDQIDFFDGGALARRTEDPNGDGLPERITRFDAEGRPAERDEDSDGNGALDTRSYYESGRLVRRILLNEDEHLEP